MNDKPDTSMPRTPLWRVIFGCAKSILFLIVGVAILFAAFAAINWSAPYGWALWQALAKGMSSWLGI
ncbi:hypothetical protein [Modicisalibacter sp. MOD 31.J]|uniref:hypothetical protein n=1 Tax=Modicisalibacter sp. MOD 31.J TaxID=2831897 RepID=UPI001CCB6E06|nr:hypothetical protein [Modicisalibacter sp. MOD 31.J]MBZ9574594.1 hypothetical protein [Modicisalibacter sp. MOD 31.J]